MSNLKICLENPTVTKFMQNKLLYNFSDYILKFSFLPMQLITGDGLLRKSKVKFMCIWKT